MNQTSLWLLLAAVMVGFSAAWLVFEVRRAWSPESLRRADSNSAPPADTEDLRDLMPTLVEEVTQLRREIAAVRAAELEVALRNRHRELLLTQALRTSPNRTISTPIADTARTDAPVNDITPEVTSQEASSPEASSPEVTSPEVRLGVSMAFDLG
jgi:hypothetical protein